MYSRLKRGAISFGFVLVAFALYRAIAVPLIEPPAEAANPEGGRHLDLSQLPQARYARLFGKYFPPGSWELDSPTVLESDQAKLLVKDYKTLPNGQIKLERCSMLFFPKGSADTTAQAIVLQAPQGALLQFDKDFDLRKAKIGKLLGGKLDGPVSIYSSPNRPDGSDALYITTRDVELAEDRIWTASPVDFRLGPNQGHGREMQIRLATREDPSEKKRGPSMGGLDSLELVHEVKVQLHLGGGLMPGPLGNTGNPPGPANAPSSVVQPPVEVTCQGPFRFQMQERVARFSDRVDVVRMNATGPSDQLSCEQLSVFFSPRNNGESRNGGRKPPDLQPSRIEALGNPVSVRSPSTDGSARCQRLEYDLPSGRITLEGSEEAMLRRGRDEIHSPHVEYEPGEPGGFGNVLASGPGWLRGALEKAPEQTYSARWARELRVRPYEQRQVVSLTGAAQVEFAPFGKLKAEELHLWLARSMPDAHGVAGTSTLFHTVGYAQGNDRTANSPARQLRPDKMLALGTVGIDSPQLTGATGRLEVWFAEGQDARDFSAGGVPAAGRSAPRHGPVTQRFDVGGGQIRIRMAMHGQRAEVAEISVDNNAHFDETKTPQPGDKPILARGDRLHVAGADTPAATVDVIGKPARVEARGMTLVGAKIQLERSTNRLWCDGQGKMTMPVTADLTGRGVKTTENLEVTWLGGLSFDGRLIAFDRSVIAKGEHSDLRTERLEVVLKRRIDFASPPSREKPERPEVDQLICRGGALMENRTFDERGQVSIDTMQLRDLAISQVTGAIDGHGPGSVTTIRRGAAQLLAQPAAPGQDSSPAAAKKPDDDRLTYLNVQFERALGGNMRPLELTFSDQVKTTYGPVAKWDQKLDADDPKGLGPETAVLTCSQLTVRMRPSQQSGVRGPFELETAGNTRLDGTGKEPGLTYAATADRLTYSEEKGLLILEGATQNPAQLYRQERTGGPMQHTAARKIWYWPKTNGGKIEDGLGIDLGSPFGTPPEPQNAPERPARRPR